MAKSGTFEITNEAYITLVKFYETFKNSFNGDTFEEFCGRMLMRGVGDLSTEFIKTMEK